MNSKAIKRQLLAAIAMVLVAALALGSSTFAWFVNNAKVTAARVNVTAATAYSLLISHDNSICPPAPGSCGTRCGNLKHQRQHNHPAEQDGQFNRTIRRGFFYRCAGAELL